MAAATEVVAVAEHRPLSRALSRGLSATLAIAIATLPQAALAAPEADAADAPTEDASPTEGTATATTDTAPVGDAAPADDAAPTATGTEPAAPADAETDKAAQAYRQGSDAYELGKFADAAASFGTAWELSHKAPLLYNLGQAHWKWFDVDPDIEHLRQARLFFTNYDKRMRLTDGYDSAEIAGYLEQIEKQIADEEKRIEEANRPVIIQSAALTEEEVQREQRRRTTRALNISGNVLIIAGAVSLGAGIGGMASRAVYGAVLDNTTGRGEATVNLATAEEDSRRRNGYQVSGQVAFGTLLAAVVMLPIGITLRSIGARRMKIDGEETGGKRKRKSDKQARAQVLPSVGGVTVRF